MVNVFSSKILIEDTVFMSLTEDGTAISKWSSEPREGLTICRYHGKGSTVVLSYFKILSD